MDGRTGWSGLLAGGIALALTGAAPAAAQQQGTIYYMIPTLLDEFQTESQKAIEGGVRRDGLRGGLARRAEPARICSSTSSRT